MNDDTNAYLAIGQFVSLGLFILSEVIGKSNCKATGVVEFIYLGFACSCKNVREEEVVL